jgi:hypothetical protein
MFEGYRVVVVCPAGRRHVADLMRRHVELARPAVDEFHWWLNTPDQQDQEYFRGLERAAPEFYRTISLPGPMNYWHRAMTIGRFYVFAIDTRTIYIRIDDDVVWMVEGCLEKLLAHRVRYPDAYLVYGNIVNSSRFMHLHQKHGAFNPGFPISYAINHRTNRQSFPAGLAAHEAILQTAEAIAHGGNQEALLRPWTALGRHVFGAGEHNDANLLSWFGRDFVIWRGICPPHVHEEQWICLRMPAAQSRIHEACGDALCVHYASEIQWPHISSQPQLLVRYNRLAPVSKIQPVLEEAPADSVATADTVS